MTMHTESSRSNSGNRRESEFADPYYPAMPSATVVEIGRRIAGALDRYK